MAMGCRRWDPWDYHGVTIDVHDQKAIPFSTDHTLEMAIIRFQREQMRLSFADGIIRPNDNTESKAAV